MLVMNLISCMFFCSLSCLRFDTPGGYLTAVFALLAGGLRKLFDSSWRVSFSGKLLLLRDFLLLWDCSVMVFYESAEFLVLLLVAFAISPSGLMPIWPELMSGM